jgi:crotonobetainyl-CoA:carnitine CoA-transferase CaiB-like acyl-CoA transferase
VAAASPLLGTVALDLTDEAGVQGARLLAELGARVIRVEDSAGDRIRRRPPFVDGREGLERSLAHLLYNAGKQSVALPLSSAESWDVVASMAARADVVLAPLAKSEHARRFFDVDRLCATNPQLCVVDVVFRRGATAPGDDDVPDLIGVAAGGLVDVNGFPEDPPNLPFGKLGYRQVSFTLASTATALLLDRRLHGRGGNVSVSLQEAAAMTTMQASNENMWRWQGWVTKRSGAMGFQYPVLSAKGTIVVRGGRSTLQTRDGRWVTFALWPAAWSGFARLVATALGSDRLLEKEWDDPSYRVQHHSEVEAAIEGLCAALTRDDLIEQAQRAGHLVLPVNDAGDLARDEHLQARGFFNEVYHPLLDRTLHMPGSVFLSSAYSRPALAPAPGLGEHNDLVLGEWRLAPPFNGSSGVSQPIASAGEAASASDDATSSTLRPGPTRGSSLPTRLPLSGYRVVDFCWQAAGPLVTRTLADWGAEVIKIESAVRLDRVREYHHPPTGATVNTGGFFNDCNTNKQSFTVDLGTVGGPALMRELIASADAVTTNFSPNVLDRWGLGYEDLCRMRPGIIMAAFPAMGSFGPHCGWRAIGNGVTGLCGLAAHTGFPDRDPVGLGTLHTDFTLAPLGAMQIMAALLEREATGEGCNLEIAQCEAGVHLLDTALLDALLHGRVAPRIGNRSAEFAPHGVYRCAGPDRWVAIAVRSTLEWQILCAVMGRDDLATRTDLQTFAGRSLADAELEAAITAWTERQDPWQATQELRAHGVPASPVENVADLVDGDPGMAGFYQQFAHPDGVDILVMHQPWLWNGERLPLRLAPSMGEHTEAILGGLLGKDEEQAAELVLAGVIR